MKDTTHYEPVEMASFASDEERKIVLKMIEIFCRAQVAKELETIFSPIRPPDVGEFYTSVRANINWPPKVID